MQSNFGLSRKEKLALWRAQKAGTGAGAGAGAGAGEGGKSKAGDSSGSGAGVLAERANNSAGNCVPGKKRAASHASKGDRGRGLQRKPFQVKLYVCIRVLVEGFRGLMVESPNSP